jgi:hypothetical protein
MISPAQQRGPANFPSPATLEVSETEPAVAIGTSQELDRALHKAGLNCTPQHPIVVTLYVHGHRLTFGLGLPKSFVSVQPCERSPGSGHISMGDGRAGWGVVSFFRGWHHTEVPERNLLPTSKARQIVRDFFETRTRSTVIDWETL